MVFPACSAAGDDVVKEDVVNKLSSSVSVYLFDQKADVQRVSYWQVLFFPNSYLQLSPDVDYLISTS